MIDRSWQASDAIDVPNRVRVLAIGFFKPPPMGFNFERQRSIGTINGRRRPKFPEAPEPAPAIDDQRRRSRNARRRAS